MFLTWNADPILIQIGPLAVRWYGLLFAIGFFLGLKLMQWIYTREKRAVAELDGLLLYVMLGTIVGARLVHCFFYEPQYYLSHPFEILKVWQGGLASHGGAVGVLLALAWYCRGSGKPRFLWLLDRLAIPATLAGALIRIGNFFNSEIVGLPTQQGWGVIFKRVDELPRHPVQLYEAAVYLFIFMILLSIYKRAKSLKDGLLFGSYLVLVFAARFALEFLKIPQSSLDNDAAISMGQMLSVPFILVGLFFLWWARQRTIAAPLR